MYAKSIRQSVKRDVQKERVVNFSKDIVGNISDKELEIVLTVCLEKYPVY